MGKKGTTVMPGVYSKLKGRKESSKILSPLKRDVPSRGAKGNTWRKAMSQAKKFGSKKS